MTADRGTVRADANVGTTACSITPSLAPRGVVSPRPIAVAMAPPPSGYTMSIDAESMAQQTGNANTDATGAATDIPPEHSTARQEKDRTTYRGDVSSADTAPASGSDRDRSARAHDADTRSGRRRSGTPPGRERDTAWNENRVATVPGTKRKVLPYSSPADMTSTDSTVAETMVALLGTSMVDRRRTRRYPWRDDPRTVRARSYPVRTTQQPRTLE